MERWTASHQTDIPLVAGRVAAAGELDRNGSRVSPVMANSLLQRSICCDVLQHNPKIVRARLAREDFQHFREDNFLAPV